MAIPNEDPRWTEYIRSHTTAEDPFLTELKEAAKNAGIPAIQVAPEQGAQMQVLLRLMGAREVVEVGTLAGYSAIWMARALPEDGRVRTIELSPDHANFAEKWVAKSDVAGMVEVHRGAGTDILPTFADHSADAAFIDADKANYCNYVTQCLRIVRPGGLIAVDNAFAFGQLFADQPTETGVFHVREFNEWFAALDEVQAVITPFGDGCWVGVKR